MERCETCGNEYPNMISVTFEGKAYWFDSFECAIHKLAPKCAHCGCRIIGHGLEAEGTYFCCAHCARKSGHPSTMQTAG